MYCTMSFSGHSQKNQETSNTTTTTTTNTAATSTLHYAANSKTHPIQVVSTQNRPHANTFAYGSFSPVLNDQSNFLADANYLNGHGNANKVSISKSFILSKWILDLMDLMRVY